MIFQLEKAILFSSVFREDKSEQGNLSYHQVNLLQRQICTAGGFPFRCLHLSGTDSVQLTCLGAAAPRGCGEQLVPMGLDLGPKCRAGLGVQSTGQAINEVFVMSWWWRRAAKSFPVFISHNIVIVVAWKKGEIFTHASSAGIRSSIFPED